MNLQNGASFYRFQVFQGTTDENGVLKKTKNVGMAYQKAGQKTLTLRLWTFSWDRYYILPHREDASKYLLLTREANRNPEAKNKYYWNIIGNGVADTKKGVIEFSLDLFDKTFFINIHPEKSAHTVDLPMPDSLDEIA